MNVKDVTNVKKVFFINGVNFNKMERVYTKEQLIIAQQKYNQNVADNPEYFDEYKSENMLTEDVAISQIEYLISLIESE